MILKDILKDAILFTGKTELLGLSTFDVESEILPTADQQGDIDLFVKCFNFIYKEISASYIPLLHSENITFTNGTFNYSSLTKSPLIIKSLKTGGKPVPYHIYPTYLEADTLNAKIVYAYLPDDFVITDEVNLFGGQILPQIMAYGVAREWSLINGDSADADVWESRFKNGIFMALSQKRNKKIPARRFR